MINNSSKFIQFHPSKVQIILKVASFRESSLEGKKSVFEKAEDDLISRKVKEKRKWSKLESPKVRKTVKKSIVNAINEICDQLPVMTSAVKR